MSISVVAICRQSPVSCKEIGYRQAKPFHSAARSNDGVFSVCIWHGLSVENLRVIGGRVNPARTANRGMQRPRERSRYIDARTIPTAISHQRDPLKVATTANSSPKSIHPKNPVCGPEWRMPQYLPATRSVVMK